MRVLFLVALCLAVAFARQPYSNRSQFQRLLRQLQQQQGQGQRYQQEQGLYNDQDEQDYDDEDEYNQQGKQCSRGQRYGSLNLNDDDEEQQYNECEQVCDEDDYHCQRECQQQQQYNEQDGSYQTRYNQQGRRHQQQYDEEDGPFQSQYNRQGRRQQFDQEDDDQFESQYNRQGRRQQFDDQDGQFQTRYNQQGRHQQQQRHQCQPKYQLLQELEQPNVHLASKLYKQAKQENDDKNTVTSPASLQLALAAIQRGARGHTKRQLQRITGAGLNQKQIRQAHTALQQILHGQDPTQRQQSGQQQQSKVKTTTTIVINQRTRTQQQFIKAVQSCLNVQVKKCDFQRQPQQCRQQINRYVAQKTNHKLQQTVPQEAVTENTKMVVINTAQVKARWGRQVRQQQQTRHGRFYPLGCQRPKPVQMLQSQGRFNYYEDEQLKVVGLPTQQQELTLYVIVPKSKDGLNQVEKSQIQDGEQLKQLLEQTEQQREHVRVQLPKFQIKHKLDAQQTLRKEGVQAIFEADEADLSGINGQQQQERYQQYNGQQDEEQTSKHQLHVNKLIHQATIKVDEQGINAARQHPGQQYGEHQSQYDQQQQYGQYEPEQYGQYGEEDEDDEQEQQYHQQQFRRQETFDDIFGQHRRQQRFGRNPFRRNQQHQQYQPEYEQDFEQYEQYDDEYPTGQSGIRGQRKQVKANRAFAFALKHNPSNQIVLVGRVVDATQKPKQQSTYGQRQGQQSLNGVDQQ